MIIAVPVGWLLFGSGTLTALLIAIAERAVADVRRREALAQALYARELARALVTARGAPLRASPPRPILEGAQVASLGDLRRRIRAGEFADDTATAEQARLRWARWAVAHGVFGEHLRDEGETAESDQADATREGADDAAPAR